jgi:hypothetical protein
MQPRVCLCLLAGNKATIGPVRFLPLSAFKNAPHSTHSKQCLIIVFLAFFQRAVYNSLSDFGEKWQFFISLLSLVWRYINPNLFGQGEKLEDE